MKKLTGTKRIGLATSVAVLLHLGLLLVVRVDSGSEPSTSFTPPETHYLSKRSGVVPTSELDARIVWSPLVFSLPSEMGFSRELVCTNLKTRLSLSQQTRAEHYLEQNVILRYDAALNPEALMLISFRGKAPMLPTEGLHSNKKGSAPQRVYVDPQLKDRLVGGIILPLDLNKEAGSAWEVRAFIRVSEQGIIRHVFLNKPLESSRLNEQILQLLYKLRFKPSETSTEGYIEIFSSETSGDKEGVL